MESPESVAPCATEPDSSDALREQLRDSLFLTATILFDGTETPLTVRIRNLSAGGMMVNVPSSRASGLGLTATLNNIGDIRGHVVWSTAKRMGIEFDVEIDPARARRKPEVRNVPGYNRPVIASRRPGLAIR